MSRPPLPRTAPITPVGLGRSELLAAALLLALRFRRQNQVIAPISKPAPTTTPTLIPALAPAFSSWFSTSDIPSPVGVGATFAQWGAPLTKVQLCVTAQHPPPRLAGHVICLVVQPWGTCDTTAVAEVDGLTVERHAPPVAHTKPCEQHLPPRDEGQPYMEVWVQVLGQHPGATDVVTAPFTVLVTVTSHWNSCSLQTEPHVEPMGQHAARAVAVGLTIQLFGHVS